VVQQLVVGEKKPTLDDEVVGLRKMLCANGQPHKVCVVRYRDGSIGVFCPYFGRVGLDLGCRIRQARCRFFKAV